MTIDLSADARARLDGHLDAVEQALIASGRSREQRRGIVDDLETQIMDMLAKQSAAPTLADVEAVLARLDPPAAYRSSPLSPPHPIDDIARERPSAAAAAMNTSTTPAALANSPVYDTVKSTVKRSFFMKSSVLVALIVCGTLLLMTPAIASHFQDVQNQQANQQLVSLMSARADLNNIRMDFFHPEPLGDTAKFGLWLTGSIAIGAGVIGGFVAFSREGRH